MHIINITIYLILCKTKKVNLKNGLTNLNESILVKLHAFYKIKLIHIGTY